MSQRVTVWSLAALAALAGVAGSAQTMQGPARLDWRPLGQPTIDLHLAGVASGPVSSVWFSPSGDKLALRTVSGSVFETSDFENWSRSDATRLDPGNPPFPTPAPEPAARTVTASGDSRHIWALGRDLFQSEDSGATWTNLTKAADASVIGLNQHAVAVDPLDSENLAVANDAGVWQSHDGGRSWVGLNERLPNLPATRILSTRRGSVRIALTDGRVLMLPDARASWTVAPSDPTWEAETRDRQRLKALLGVEITALTRQGDYVYAGSADGRLWVSRDRGVSWILPQAVGRGAVERIYADPEAPRSALAVMAGAGARVVRTVNAGAVWDDISGNLGELPVHSVTADRASGVAYLATDRGVYTAHVDLVAFTPASQWTAVSGSLPAAAPAMDIAFDSTVGQIFVALRGYGLYTAAIQRRGAGVRLINAADLSSRAAAPGSLVSVAGGKVIGVRGSDMNFPLLASGENEAQIQVPFEARAVGLDLSVELASGRVTVPLQVHSVSPAIFVDQDGAPILVDGDSGLALEATAATHSRQRLELMATGLGRVQPDWPTGVPAPADHPPAVSAGVEAYLDGVPLEVTQATLAPGYVGYYVVGVQLPAVVNSGPADLYLVVNGEPSNHVRVMIASD